MIRIVVNGQILDSPEVTIPYRWQNNFLNPLQMKVDYTLPFDLPATDRNRRILNFPDAEIGSNSQQEFYCQIFKFESLLIAGKLVVNDAANRLKCAVISGYNQDIKNILSGALSDIQLDTYLMNPGYNNALIPWVDSHYISFRIEQATPVPVPLVIDIYRRVNFFSPSDSQHRYTATWQGDVRSTVLALKSEIEAGNGVTISGVPDNGALRVAVYNLGVTDHYWIYIWDGTYSKNLSYDVLPVVDSPTAGWFALDVHTSTQLTDTSPFTKTPPYWFNGSFTQMQYIAMDSILSVHRHELPYVFFPIKKDMSFLTRLSPPNVGPDVANFYGDFPTSLVSPSYLGFNFFQTNRRFGFNSPADGWWDFFTFLPAWKVKNLLQIHFDQLGWQLSGSFFDDAELANLLIIGNKLIQSKFWEDGSYAGPPQDFFFDSHVPGKISLSNFLPGVTIQDLIQSLRTGFGVSINVDPISLRVIIDKPQTVTGRIRQRNITKWYEATTSVVPPKTTAIKFSFNTKTDDASMKVLESDFSGQLKPGVQLYSDLLALTSNESNDYRLVESENSFYKYNSALGTWEFYRDNIQAFTYGTGSTFDWKINWLPIPTHRLSSPTFYNNVLNTATSLIPRDNRRPVSDEMEDLQGASSSEIRFTIYRGMQQDSASATYPMASYIPLDTAGNSIGNYALTLDGPSGLFEKFLRFVVLNYSAKKTIVMRFTMPVTEFEAIRNSELINVIVKEGSYYISEMNASVSGRERIQVDLTLIPAANEA